MNSRKLGWHFALVACLLLAARTALDAQGPAKSALDSMPTKVEKISIKAYSLTQRDPNEVRQAVHGLLGELSGGFGAGLGFVGGGLVGGVGMQSALAGGVSAGGFGGGILGGGPDGGINPMTGAWRAAVDPRTRVLLVRGTDKDLQTASDLVTLLDAPADQPRPQLKNMTAFSLKHASAESLAAGFNLDEQVRLNLSSPEMIVLHSEVRFTSLPSAQLLVAAGPEASLKQLHDVVQKLDAPGVAGKDKKSETAIFRFKLCDPEEVKEALARLLQRDDADGAAPPVFGALGPVMPGPVEAGDEPQLHLVVDPRTRSLLIRGTAIEVQVAKDLVAVLETPANKPVPKVKSLEAFQLKHADADELANVIQELGVKVQMVAMPMAKLLVVAGRPEELRSIRQVVEQLDVVAPEEPAPKERRKLFRDAGL